MSYRVYFVEDEPNLQKLLATYMEKEGWQVTVFSSGTEAESRIEDRPAIWILDIMLPGMDGFELIRKIKSLDRVVPIIFISARDQDLDRIVGLEMGSDDYLAKPFLPRELVIRAKKLLERCYGEGVEAGSVGERRKESEEFPTEQYGPYAISFRDRCIYSHGERIELTAKEFELVSHFVRHVGWAFSRDEILNQVWGSDYFGSDRVVDDLIRRVRKKLPFFAIETLYAYGYRLVGA